MEEKRDLRRDCATCAHYNPLRSIFEGKCASCVYSDGNPPTNWEAALWSLNAFAEAVHENAVAHGWWNTPPTFPEIVAMCHCELSEALQQYRDGGALVQTCAECEHKQACKEDGVPLTNERCKPEGIAVEMIDCVLRILDWCAAEGVDVEKLLRTKHRYNIGRPYRHGNKRI